MDTAPRFTEGARLNFAASEGGASPAPTGIAS